MSPLVYELTIIGSGPAGYAAALRAADLGLKVCLIEKGLLGGVCLNRGCIPTKTIIHTLRLFQNIKKSRKFGIDVNTSNIDVTTLFKRKDEVVFKLRHGIEQQLKLKKVDIIQGSASLEDKNSIRVGKELIKSKYILIATGSSPAEKDGFKFDHRYILSSDDILDLPYIPKSAIIIGAGPIGCEFASIYNQLGCKITMIEMMPQILPRQDTEIAKRLEFFFKRAGIEIIKGSKVTSIDTKKNGVRIILEGTKEIEAEAALLCVGRKPNISGLNLEKLSIRCDDGKISVDDTLRTSISSIYAAGDITGRYYLAHAASYEGALVSDNLSVSPPHKADYSALPECIYTEPEIASIGLTEKDAREKGDGVIITKVPFSAISKAHIEDEIEGLIKLISDKNRGLILGVHIFGPSASELITTFAVAMRWGITVKQISQVIYAHPTLSEAILEVASRTKT